MTNMVNHHDAIQKLPCWRGPVTIEPVPGGMTNLNFCVTHAGTRYFVRLGADIPVHGIMRFNELAATKAAAQCGLSPRLHYNAPGVIVLDWLDAVPLNAEDARKPDNIRRLAALIRSCHHDASMNLRGPVLAFPVFHVLRDYAATIEADKSRHAAQLPQLMERARQLERAVGPARTVFSHNDMLAANILDDGKRLWLVDWDYAGFGHPLFDLANCASNYEFDGGQRDLLLRSYFGAPADKVLMLRLQAMICASLLREAMWTMVAERHSDLKVDYAGYLLENQTRFERQWAMFCVAKDGA